MSRRWRRLSRIDELRRLRARAATGMLVGEQRNRRSSEAARTRRSPTRAASSARSGASSGPRTQTAKSTRGGLWPGVFMSSMTLMPPTNAMRPSTWHSLRCRRRSRCERNCHGAISGRYLRRSTPPAARSPLQRIASGNGAHPSRRPARARRRLVRRRRPARRRSGAPPRRRRRCRSRARSRARPPSIASSSAGKVLGAVAQQRHGVARRVAVHCEAGDAHVQRLRFGTSSKVAASAA